MKLLKPASLLLALVPLQGCAPVPVPTASVKPFCRTMTNVCVKNADVLTDETASAIEGNNLGRERLCGKPPKCKA